MHACHVKLSVYIVPSSRLYFQGLRLMVSDHTDIGYFIPVDMVALTAVIVFKNQYEKKASFEHIKLMGSILLSCTTYWQIFSIVFTTACKGLN